MPFKAFVSYSAKDLPLVKRVRTILKDAGVENFIAEHSVIAGDRLPEKIIQGIKTSDLFLLIWSHAARESEWVQQEVGVAVATRKVVLPVLLSAKFEPPGFLKGIKYIRADKNPEETLQVLRDNVFGRAQKKDQRQGLAWIGIMIVIFFLLSRTRIASGA